MRIHSSHIKGLFDSKFCQVIQSRNDLQIGKIDYIKDKQRSRLVIFLESNLMLDREVSAFINGNTLIVEAPRSLDFDKPYKSHLIDIASLPDYGEGILKIGFSELQLNRGFEYSLISCRAMNNGLLKIILGIRPKNEKLLNTIN